MVPDRSAACNLKGNSALPGRESTGRHVRVAAMP